MEPNASPPQPRNPWGWVTEARVTYALKCLMVAVLAVYLGSFVADFLARIHTVVLLVVVAVFFAYLIYPAVQLLRRRMPLVLAIAVVYVVLLALLVAAGAFLIPRLMDDAQSLVTHYPELSSQASAFATDPNNPVLSRLPSGVRDEIIQVPTRIAEWLRVNGAQAIQRTLPIVVGTFAAVATFVIIPLITAYLLLDMDNLKRGLDRLIPESRRRSTTSFLAEVDKVVGGFIRGQVIVAISIGVLLTIALLVLHVRYAFLLGLAAAIGDLIPYIGAILVFVPSVLIALLSNGWINALLVALAFVLIYEVEGHVLAPTIVSTQVKLSPLVVLIAILIGAELGGIVGMLVAVPVAGVLRAIVVRAANLKSP